MASQADGRIRKLFISAMLLGVALILSYVEAMLPPLGLFKLGLANIAITLTVFLVSRPAGLAVSLCRVAVKNGNKVTLTTDTEAFLFNEGFITWDKKEKVFVYSLGENSKNMTEEEAINAIYTSYVPNDMITVVSYWATAQKLLDYFAFLEKQAYFESIDEEDRIKNISGIKYANKTEAVTVNGVEYGVPTLDENGAVIEGNEVLSITIEKVDPKAIWNFGFTVAPITVACLSSMV